MQVCDGSAVAIAGGARSTLWIDWYCYMPSLAFTVLYNSSSAGGTGLVVNSDGSMDLYYVDSVVASSAASAVPAAAWFRLQVKSTTSGIQIVNLFKGANIDGATADVSITHSVGVDGYIYLSPGFGGYIDHVIITDSASAPTRTVATARKGWGVVR